MIFFQNLYRIYRPFHMNFQKKDMINFFVSKVFLGIFLIGYWNPSKFDMFSLMSYVVLSVLKSVSNFETFDQSDKTTPNFEVPYYFFIKKTV